MNMKGDVATIDCGGEFVLRHNIEIRSPNRTGTELFLNMSILDLP